MSLLLMVQFFCNWQTRAVDEEECLLGSTRLHPSPGTIACLPCFCEL